MTSAFRFKISDPAFKYLKLQRGAIADFSYDRKLWERKYHESLHCDFSSIAPFLPPQCGAVLDIGSGLGGIDAMLSKAYGGVPEIYLLDGMDDQPILQKHNRTFSRFPHARDFLTANGVPASRIFAHNPKTLLEPVKVDLILSFQSYCFHYNPETYLEFVRACASPGAILIFDVRSDYRTWHRVLNAEFQRVGIALEGQKFQRVVFRA